MTLINLIALTFVGSYPQVTLLSMAKIDNMSSVAEQSVVPIERWAKNPSTEGNERPHNVLKTPTAQVAERTLSEKGSDEITELPLDRFTIESGIDRESPPRTIKDLEPGVKNWVLNLWLFQIQRTETWTPFYYDIQWKFRCCGLGTSTSNRKWRSRIGRFKTGCCFPTARVHHSW